MKVLILAGGKGTRISEESGIRPKPMVEIGGKPILWHIMKSYSVHGFNDFVILVGHLGYSIKEYFANYFLHQSDIRFDLRENKMETLSSNAEPWKVTLLDTGLDTLTGGRIIQARDHIDNEPFLLTYGDGVSDVDINKLVSFHKSHGKLATMTSIRPESRFGILELGAEGKVESFREKPKGEDSWINGGFFVCEPAVMDYIQNGNKTIFEREPLEKLAEKNNLRTFHHHGFWHCMDTLRDKINLEEMWRRGDPPWKSWD